MSEALYLDSSAFVKLLVAEAESSALRDLLAATPMRRVSSALLRTEVLRALRHLGAEGLTLAREGLRRVDLISLDDRILDSAGILEPGVLRTLDALHIATAMTLGDDLHAIVTYDQRMAGAARLLGLRVVSPAPT